MSTRCWLATAAAVTLGAGLFPANPVVHARAAGPAACVATGTMSFNPPLDVKLGAGYAFTLSGNASPCVGVVAGPLSGGGSCPSGGLGGVGGGSVATCLSVLNGGAVVEAGTFSISSPPGTCSGTWLRIGTVFEAECGVDGLGVLTFTALFLPSPAFQAPIANGTFTGVVSATL